MSDIADTQTQGSAIPTPASSPLRERLFADAERIQPADIEALDESVPKKLDSFSFKGLDERITWFRTMIDRVRLLFEMVRDREFALGGKNAALIAAGLIYFVLPTDLTPDFIPGIGYLDDALVLNILWKTVVAQVERYTAFKQARAEAASLGAAPTPDDAGATS